MYKSVDENVAHGGHTSDQERDSRGGCGIGIGSAHPEILMVLEKQVCDLVRQQQHDSMSYGLKQQRQQQRYGENIPPGDVYGNRGRATGAVEDTESETESGDHVVANVQKHLPGVDSVASTTRPNGASGTTTGAIERKVGAGKVKRVTAPLKIAAWK